GRPAAGVRLRCFAHDAGRNWMDIAGPVTGADGGFTFVGLPFPGEERELRVFGTGPGYGVGCSVPLRGRPMSVVEGVLVRVPRLVEVEGIVRDENGDPAAGDVKVTWAIPVEQEAYRSLLPTDAVTRSGEDGKFKVMAPERAPVRAVVVSPSFQKGQGESVAPVHPDADPATPIPPPKPLVLEVFRGLAIRGVVRDRAGKPVERGEVRVEPDPPSDPRPSRDGDVGRGGEFEVGGLKEGSYDFNVVVHPEFLPETVRGVKAGGEVVEVRVRRPGRLTGRVLPLEGTAADVPAEVTLTGLGNTHPLPRVSGGLADPPERRFSWEKLSPGKYDLAIVCGDGRLHVSAIEIGEAPVDLGDLRVEPAASVGGSLTAGGKPAGGVPVEVFRVGPDGRLGESRRSTTDAAGRWRVSGLPAGTHVATARPPGHRPVEVRFEAETGKEAPIDLDAASGARVRVRVLDSAGAPAPGARVHFISEAGSVLFWEEGKPGTGPYETGPDGTLACCGLPTGDLQVTAQRPGGVAGTATVAAPAEGSVEVEVRLGKE
ncbi:MAG TPA: carboxypeptidase regulatory-like domain-containing protein, partial [Planctomycetota bacterium]|nr:carboxypeptidase regulatory-like domain-containing protein [Planctomycetota bacterium]